MKVFICLITLYTICCILVVTAYHKNCFNLGTNPYAMTIAGPLNNLCELGIKTQQIVDTIKSHCVHKNIQMEGIH